MSKSTLVILLTICFGLSGLFTNTLYANNNTSLLLTNTSPVLEDDKVLFAFGDGEVSISEFLYVYEKHNAQDKDIYSKKSIDDYLNLYINFKLKVREAEAEGIDTIPGIVKQLEQYRTQLSKNYLIDKDINEQLIKEAYDRMQKEVQTSHILILCDETASPKDTAVAYQKIVQIRKELLGDVDFKKLATKYSQDPSVRDNNGDLGYITAFQTVYPFESAAYNTAVGKVSAPVRTRFGYHLIKVTDVRKAQGQVEVAHILIKSGEKDDATKKAAAEAKIMELYGKLTGSEPAPFELIASQFSDDKTTAKKGGKLPPFGSGRMLPEFETAAFDLVEVGAVSEPFQTRIGWHVVKLLNKKGVDEYKKMKPEIRKRIERDSRSAVSRNMFINRLKKDFAFAENKKNKNRLINGIDPSVQKGFWKMGNYADDMSGEIFRISLPKQTEPKVYLQKDFAQFIERNQRKGRSSTPASTVNRLYDLFVEQELITLEESLLEEKHPEFARLMKEFRDGTLLFELTEDEVWNKAIQDTTGLEAFFAKNQQNYQWKERAEAVIYTCKTEVEAKAARKLVKKKKVNVESLLKNRDEKVSITPFETVKRATYEKGQNDLVDQATWKTGISDNITTADGLVHFVQITKILSPAPKQLKEARGYVVADYQNQLEKAWIEELKTKYPVEVKEEVLKTLYKK